MSLFGGSSFNPGGSSLPKALFGSTSTAAPAFGQSGKLNIFFI
jgi:hypothetical protein